MPVNADGTAPGSEIERVEAFGRARPRSMRSASALSRCQPTIEWLAHRPGQLQQVVLCDVTGEEDHLTRCAKGHDRHAVDPVRRCEMRTCLSDRKSTRLNSRHIPLSRMP